jgi:hypothetical protein
VASDQATPTQKNSMNETNILIAQPAFGGLTTCANNSSIVGLILALTSKNIPHTGLQISNESLIPRARNFFANMACFDKDAQGREFSHLFFSDVDVAFDPDDFFRMLEMGRDVIGLPYAKKEIDYGQLVRAVQRGVTRPDQLSRLTGTPVACSNTTDTFRFDPNKPVKIAQIGTGAMLIDRKVLEKFARNPARKYKAMPSEIIANRKVNSTRDFAIDFFQCGVNHETGYYDSEDYRFCTDAARLGFEVYMLPDAVTQHHGSFAFTCDLPGQVFCGLHATPASDQSSLKG